MKDSINVGLQERSYQIDFGPGIISDISESLAEINFSRKVALITNVTVNALHGERLLSLLAQAGFDVTLIAVKDGEEYKNLETLSFIYDELVKAGIDRSCGIIAFGGGVVGDMAGLGAATFMRGVDYVQVPTTLLSQVDSSVGGKTAVNHPSGKNLIGAFNQPRLVVIDTDYLQTLPAREFNAGMAEVVKYGVIRNSEFFDWLNHHYQDLRNLKAEALVHAIKTSCQIKADIVEIDEKESSLRAILNFGHTFGHAVESLTDYQRFLHGEAVAIGMVVAARVSQQLGYCEEADVARISDLLIKLDLPVEVPKFPLSEYLEAMMHDKKVADGKLKMVFNKGIGDCLISQLDYPEVEFKTILDEVKGR
ncbi:MAG: 3-dehydroquinate synthase [Desulfuromonas sp.]|nr:MAG: 3-dehydroquinate synthase [Desulfuromonas sp.]